MLEPGTGKTSMTRIQEAREGAKHLHPARRASLRQRPHPHRPRAEQDPEGHHRQVQDHGGLRRALRAGLGLPRPADRAPGRLKNLGPKKDTACRQAEIRKLCREYAEKFIDIQREEFKRLGVFGDWDNPYLTMDYRLRGRHRARARQVRRLQAVCTRARSRCTGAAPARPPWPRPRWSTRTTSRPRST